MKELTVDVEDLVLAVQAAVLANRDSQFVLLFRVD
jgi:hypothetical protein